MAGNRRLVLAALLGALAVATAVVFRGLLGTLFFAVTVAYVLVPVVDLLERRGTPSWWAAVGGTLAAFGGAVAVLLPLVAVLYLRRAAALALLRSLPDSVTLSVGGLAYVVDAGDVTSFLATRLTRLAIDLAGQAPVLGAKVAVFGFVVFALLYRGDRLRRAVLAALPPAYHDVAEAFHERTRATLFSLYVIQAATALATFAVALVLFLVLGVRYPVTLAVVAGVLQVLPVVGPSLVILGLVAADLVAGDLVGAAVMAVLGLALVGFLPDAVLRPRLARQTARLPASLYFVGFTGGLLGLGPVGIIAGPLAVALLLEVLALLAEEMDQSRLDAFET